MKQYFITGTSSGIGKALAEQALEAGHKVVGISRRKRSSTPTIVTSVMIWQIIKNTNSLTLM
ncbi:MAG: NAD-dependent epimerase/dehydratase family protein [Owenweeksia sp.]|nr:NAD-dependent epimerase/dehydratase family protein [Owenweeksia sp.]